VNAKEYLSQARMLEQRINAKLDRVSRLRALTQKVTVTMNDDPVSHTRNVTSLQDQIIRLMEAEESLNRQIDMLVDFKAEVQEVLELIDDEDDKLVLELHYLCFRSWEEIAEVMNYHVRSIYRIHGQALQKLNTILASDEYTQIHAKHVSKCQ